MFQIRKDTENGMARNNGHKTQLKTAIAKMEARAAEDSGGSIILISWQSKDEQTFMCLVCGTMFKRCKNKRRITCPACREAAIAKRKEDREIDAEVRRIERDAELSKHKICASCGNVFHSEYATQIYCCKSCKRREREHRRTQRGVRQNSHNHRKRARRLGTDYESGITLGKLVERDGNICQICGGPCDSSDTSWGFIGPLYPSVDHIKPMAKGGGHTWDNVQLAHCICNSMKRDVYAEEQGAAD